MVIFFIIFCFDVEFVVGQGDVDGRGEVGGEVLRYRRWFAPYDRISSWPFGDGRYVPMRRDLFEQRVLALTAQNKIPNTEKKCNFTRIVLNGRVDGNQIVDGRGSFEVARNDLLLNDIAPLPNNAVHLPNNAVHLPNNAATAANLDKSSPQSAAENRSLTSGQRTDIADKINLPELKIPLEPWGQWIKLIPIKKADGTTLPLQSDVAIKSDARLVYSNDGAVLLVLPAMSAGQMNTANIANAPANTANIATNTSINAASNTAANAAANAASNTAAKVANVADSNLRLLQQIDFEWSLRGRQDASRGELQFDFIFPCSVGVEVNLELPIDRVLTSSTGLVVEGAVSGKEKRFRSWRILSGTDTKLSITISSAKEQQPQKTAVGFKQAILYNISPLGADVTTTFSFDQTDSPIDKLTFEFDLPLVPVVVRAGGTVIHSPLIEQFERDGKMILNVDLSHTEAAHRHEISVAALSPVKIGSSNAEADVKEYLKKYAASDAVKQGKNEHYRNDNVWRLPRVRAVSNNLFWKETRCTIIVQRPMMARNLTFTDSVQVRPTADMERSPHDAFELQYFNDAAQVAINVYQEESQIITDSLTQIHLNDDTISGTMNLAVRTTAGKKFSLTFPISQHWAIHSVKGIAGDDILAWDIIPANEQNDLTQDTLNGKIDSFLSVKLKRSLPLGDVLRLQVVGRFHTDSRREFRLSEFSPILLPLQKRMSNFIAIQIESSTRLQYRLQNSALFELHDYSDAVLQSLITEQPEGVLFPLDVRTHEIAFRAGRLRSDYSAEIIGKMNIGKNNFNASYKFKIKPRESAVERLYIHFTDTNNTKNPKQNQQENTPQFAQQKIKQNNQSRPNKDSWTWEIKSDLAQIPSARIVGESEFGELLGVIGNRNIAANFKDGELWEIRLSPLQNVPFEVTASKSFEVSDEIIFPFVSFPASRLQSGEIYLESAGNFPYSISANGLRSIPFDVLANRSDGNIRAAFRYDPLVVLRRLDNVELRLDRIDANAVPPDAWIWLRQLDTQYGKDGVIKNCVNFLIESRGKESLHIILPQEVSTNNVDVVWLNNKQTTWRPMHLRGLTVAIPPSERFVTVSVEYSYKNNNSKTTSQIRPDYPETDIPILSSNFVAWFHPDYEVVDSSTSLSTASIFGKNISNGISQFLGYKKNDAKAAIILREFNEYVLQEVANNAELTWRELLGDEKRLGDFLLQKIRAGLGNKFYEAGDVRFYVDMAGLGQMAIMPDSRIAASDGNTNIHDYNSLVIFATINQTPEDGEIYTFYLTSFVMAGVHGHFGGEQIDNLLWITDDGKFKEFILPNTDATDDKQSGNTYESLTGITIGKPQLLPASKWIQTTTRKTDKPIWSNVNHSFRHGNISPDWSACEITQGNLSKHFLIDSNLIKCYYLTAFLLVVILSYKFSSVRIWQFVVIIILCQVIHIFLTPFYAAINSGIAAGLIAAILISLIRRKRSSIPHK
ncbi:MAG: hypothetical protein LBQ66_01575, partial [Planctomycetaceae bacterium]|nr:hypothetical protein [Planctomycetaceae bacterium]